MTPTARIDRLAGGEWLANKARVHRGSFVMAVILVVLGFYLIWPVILLLVNSFNIARDVFVGPAEWGLDNWRVAFREPGLIKSILNTFLIWGLVLSISFPLAILISWTIARTRIPFSNALEVMFWVSFMLPGISTTIGWIGLLEPNWGALNLGLRSLPFFGGNEGPFNIFSIPGIVWVHLIGNGISFKVILLTPAFRNMDASLEEAAKVSGASELKTMVRVTIPLMASPIILVLALQLLRIFQSFETEQLLGTPFGFFVYSTLIFDLVRDIPPRYGAATVLASITLIIVAFIIPVQRWMLQRRLYTTIAAGFKPGLVNLGQWKWIVFGLITVLVVLLTIAPVAQLILQSFMTRAGYFDIHPTFTLYHWSKVLTDSFFLSALGNTIILAITAAILSPLLFSFLAYVLVRTRWRGRVLLDLIIWGSGAVPGMLSGLGLLWLFIGTPGFNALYGTLFALLIVVVIQGNTTGVNVAKGTFVQIGQEMEEAARVAGAGWFRTYFRIWIPLLMPTLLLLAVLNFTFAANTTSSIILLADAGTQTLSIMALEYASPGTGLWEEASIISVIIMVLTLGPAVAARVFGLKFGLRHS